MPGYLSQATGHIHKNMTCEDMDKKAEYMNFPITILQGAFKDISETISNILRYGTYKHSLGLEFGNESQRMKEV